MNVATVLVLGFALASGTVLKTVLPTPRACGTVLKTVLPPPQETPEAKRAIAIVRKAEGTIVFDDKASGKPVIGINL